ncbi:MAG: hypothetical protein MSG64_20925 [Pyrinomonadaceae bacterium MAG19_C2-C3]|nr:hypothetical protein [Pyrinomonadaceae bacterium MAG19_C2-C3]
MTNRNTIEPVIDQAQVEHAMSLIEDVVEKPHHLRSEWIDQHRWAAVPVESASHFHEREAEWLSKAAAEVGCYECLAVATEPLLPTEMCYRVPMTQEGLLDFSWKCAGLNYVLIPEDRSFAVLCTSDDYFIVAGQGDFVTKAIGSSIPTARKMFLRFGDDPLWQEPERSHLVKVAEKYEQYNGGWQDA